MEARSLCPIQVATFCWRPSGSSYARTVVCKATFDLLQGKAPLAATPEPISLANEYYEDGAASGNTSLYRPSECVPFKTQADVLLVGEAFTPDGEPARSIKVELIVRDVSKAIEVFRDRHFNQQDELVEGKRFTRMPLRYERASGGEMTSNPIGRARDGTRDRYGRLPIPNLQPTGLNIAAMSDTIEPIGFGPTSPNWEWRAALLGRHAKKWDAQKWIERPLPTDIDSSYFNFAPRDQRVDAISADERLVLLNLHPDEARLVTHLPGIRPAVFVERGGAARELEMRADTLWIDTSRQILTVTWRGRIDVAGPDEALRLLVGMHEGERKVTWSELAGVGTPAPPVAAPVAAPTPALAYPAAVAAAPTAPPPAAPPPAVAPPATQPPPAAPNANAPFQLGAPLGGTAGQAGAGRRQRHKTMGIADAAMATALGAGEQALPFQPGQAMPPAPLAADEIAASARPTDASNEVSIEDHAPPWLRALLKDGGPSGDNATPPQTLAVAAPKKADNDFGEHDTAPPPDTAAPPDTAPPGDGDTAPPADTSPPPPLVATPNADGVTPMSEEEATNRRGADGNDITPPPTVAATAFDVSPPTVAATAFEATPPPTVAASAIDIAPPATVAAVVPPKPVVAPADAAALGSRDTQLEMAAASTTGMRLQLGGRSAREVIELLWHAPEAAERIRNHPEWSALDAGPGSLAGDGDRRLLVTLMQRGEASNPSGLRHAMLIAGQSPAGYEAPLAVMHGSIVFAFDELAALKATTTALATEALENPSLAAIVKLVSDFLNAPWLQNSAEAALGLTRKLREASQRDLDAVSAQVQRTLLEQRNYKRRNVFGMDSLRADFLCGGEPLCPAYIPAMQASELPMYESFEARIVVEAHLKQDQFEANDTALRVLALGRAMQLSPPAPRLGGE